MTTTTERTVRLPPGYRRAPFGANGKVVWKRGLRTFGFNRPIALATTGMKGSGKSSLLEYVGEQYLANGGGIVDLLSARDAESLAWLRSPHAKDKRILLLKGDSVDVKTSYDTKKISDFTLGDLDRYDVIISSPPLYAEHNEEFREAANLINKLYHRLHWRKVFYLIIREASNLVYSRVKSRDVDPETKAELIYLAREGRHNGIALGVDTLRFKAIDIDIREIVDALCIKALGSQQIAKDIGWLYSFYKPWKLAEIPNDVFVIMGGRAVGIGDFKYPSWHKEEGEDILNEVGIEIEYGESSEIKEGVNRGTFTTVGDAEHVRIIEIRSAGKGMAKIGNDINRSSGTIKGQITRHNAIIDRSGFCVVCKRAGGKHAGEQV